MVLPGPFVFGVVVGVALTTAYWIYREFAKQGQTAPPYSYAYQDEDDDDESEKRPESRTTQDCAFCLEPCTGNDIIQLNTEQRITCGHLFHEACVMPWLQRNRTCPVCRQHVATWNKIRLRRL